ncbi:MAG: hypothetical protein WA005_02060 [Candidatus Binataceae bacterium]
MRKGFLQFVAQASLPVFFLLFALTGCATQGGGQTVTVLGHKILVTSAPVLTMQATTQCNADAQVEYNLSVAACEGKLAALAPIQLSDVNSGVGILCQGFGYVNSSGQLAVAETIALGGCATPTPAASPAPTTPAAAASVSPSRT